MKNTEFFACRLPIFRLPIAICTTAAACLCASASIHAAVLEAWVQRHSSGLGSAEDLARLLVTDSAGHVIIAGHSNDGLREDDWLILKYSGADGSVIWQQRHNGPANSFDAVGGLAVDSGDNVVIAGSSAGLGTGSDFYTAKYSSANGALLWERRYTAAGHFHDWASAVAVDRGDNVIVTGRSAAAGNYDYYTARYAAANGALLWERRYSGPSNRDDVPAAVALDAAGNVIVVGSSDGTIGGSQGIFHMIKYAATDGTVLWERRGDGYIGLRLAVDRNGDVVVNGVSDFGSTPDFVTAKYSGASGAVIWTRPYNGPANAYDQPHALALDAVGNILVTGQSFSREGGFDYYTVKYATASGAVLWERRFDGPDNGSDFAYQISVDARGDVLVTGESWGGIATRFDYHTLKYSGVNGVTLWERRHDGPRHGNDVPLAMDLDQHGNVAVTGGSPGVCESYDFFTVKYAAANGAPLWQQSYDGPFENYDAGHAAAIDPAGNVIVTGTTSGGAGPGDAYTIKYDENGSILWAHRHDGGGDFWRDAGNAVAVDANGNVVVTGLSVGPEHDPDLYTAKYAAADGRLLWQRVYNGPASSHDEGRVVAIDAGGNVIVAGQSYSSPHGGEAEPDFYTARYAAADGSLLWERRYDAAGSGDYLTGMKLDPHGNVVVTGSSSSTQGGIDAYTAKYAGANGALLWEHRYNGPANDIDHATALAIDAAGNVIVTGSSISPEPQRHHDIYTAKYAAADGRLLWEVRYNGPAGLDDEAFAVAVDVEGNAFVTGYSHGQDGRQQIYTARYRATDGALLWEQRYHGPAPSGENVGLAIAVDDAGNAVVSGYSSNGVNTDYYTAKYAAANGALLWERRYDGPLIGQDYPAARGLAVGPNGMIAVTGISDRDYATVLYRDLVTPSPRAVLAGVLAGLNAVRQSVSDRNTALRLDRSIAHLTDALDPALWRDETHLDLESGHSVFHHSHKAIDILCALARANSPNLPNATLDTFIQRIVGANRLLASIAIDDAIQRGIPETTVEHAARFLARGDATADKTPCARPVEDYRHAWKTLNRANIPAGSRGN